MKTELLLLLSWDPILNCKTNLGSKAYANPVGYLNSCKIAHFFGLSARIIVSVVSVAPLWFCRLLRQHHGTVRSTKPEGVPWGFQKFLPGVSYQLIPFPSWPLSLAPSSRVEVHLRFARTSISELLNAFPRPQLLTTQGSRSPCSLCVCHGNAQLII